MSIKTQYTEIWFIDPTDDSVVKVGCPTGISGLGGSRTQVDVTCLDSSEAEFLGGMAQPGQVSVDINFDPSSASHKTLWALNASGETVQWAIGLSDGTAPPTVTLGAFTLPGTRTFIAFEGYVADLTIDIANDDAVRGTMQVQRSGARVLHSKA